MTAFSAVLVEFASKYSIHFVAFMGLIPSIARLRDLAWLGTASSFDSSKVLGGSRGFFYYTYYIHSKYILNSYYDIIYDFIYIVERLRSISQ